MSFHNHKSTRPRSILVILGGTMAIMGMLTGTLITVPEFHRALTMDPEPVEMTWHDLVDHGLTNNSHVRLIDVQLQENNPAEAFEDVFDAMGLAGFGPEGFDPKNFDPDKFDPDKFDPDKFDPENFNPAQFGAFGLAAMGDEGAAQEQAEKMAQAMGSLNVASFFKAMLEPTKVCPINAEPEGVPAKIVIPANESALNYAHAEIEQSGTLTGRFTLTDGQGFEAALIDLLLSGQLPAAQGEQPLEQGEDTLRYVYEPVHSVQSVQNARQWFTLSLFGVAMGLVICGSGGPSLVCCLFFQIPSILSLLGYPMRYGRATRGTRLLYAGIGIALLAFGYQQMFVVGGFGKLTGSIITAIPGFWIGSIGAAALLGSVFSVVMERVNLSLEPETGRKNAGPAMTYTRACALNPVVQNEVLPYVDPELETLDTLPESLQSIADALSGIDFGIPECVRLNSPQSSEESLIQLGCQKMVVVIASEGLERLQTRLTSVLSDGLTIVTVSDPMGEQKTRMGTNGMCIVSASDDPTELLSAHLEQIIRSAEQRDSQVVEIEPDEMTGIALLALRVVADVQSQYGERQLEVGSHHYGRFQFPPAPVQTAAGV